MADSILDKGEWKLTLIDGEPLYYIRTDIDLDTHDYAVKSLAEAFWVTSPEICQAIIESDFLERQWRTDETMERLRRAKARFSG